MRPMDMPLRHPLGKDQDRPRGPAGPDAPDRPRAGDRAGWLDGPAREGAGWPDGQARSPAELLDNLRLRLSELADNHPSHRPDRAEPRVESRADAESKAGDWAGGGEQPRREDLARADDQTGAGGRILPDWIAEAIRAARFDDRAFALTDSMQAALDLPGTGGPGDPYRPWFMAGEPGSPWWAAEDGLWG
jgi:hypothetical protein